jgi:hypothetical protein
VRRDWLRGGTSRSVAILLLALGSPVRRRRSARARGAVRDSPRRPGPVRSSYSRASGRGRLRVLAPAMEQSPGPAAFGLRLRRDCRRPRQSPATDGPARALCARGRAGPGFHGSSAFRQRFCGDLRRARSPFPLAKRRSRESVRSRFRRRFPALAHCGRELAVGPFSDEDDEPNISPRPLPDDSMVRAIARVP